MNLLNNLAEISFFSKNVLGENKNLETYRQNISTIQKTKTELYS